MEITEHPTLFESPATGLYDFIRYSIFFEFRENDTIVFQKLIYISTKPRDWHFKSRLREAIKNDITDDSSFRFTKWNVRHRFLYDFNLNDEASILAWLKKPELMALLGVV